MMIQVENLEYETGHYQFTTIRNLSFAPETDLKGESISIDELSADIMTDKKVGIARWCWLFDDRNVLFGKFWVVYAEHVEAGVLRIRAKSALYLIDNTKLPAVMYDGEPVADVLDDIFTATAGALGQNIYRLDNSFSGQTVTGFCPEQTARERLVWVCFALGAYVRTCFSQYVEILPIPSAAGFIPADATFFKPSVTFGDYVTAVTAKYYSFAEGTPDTTDKWVKDAEDTVYIVTEYALTLTNSEAPNGAPANEVVIDGVYLLNADNVSAALTRLMGWYFTRTEIDMDIINNGDTVPGQRATVCADEATLYTGWVERCEFSFGMQARSKIHVVAAEETASGTLIITYTHDGIQLGQARFLLPVGYEYAITNPYIDLNVEGRRIIYRPHNAAATGTTTAGDNEVEEPCSPALDLYDGVLEIISVDGVTVDAEGIAEIE